MHLTLLGLGIAAIVAGAAMLGFGIPYNAFGIGNALIGGGITAVVGGLILIGLAMAVGQLTRIAMALEPRAPARQAAASAPSTTPTKAGPGDSVEPATAPVAPGSAADGPRPEPPLEPAVAIEPPASASVAPPVRAPARPRGADPTPPANAGEPAAGRSPRGSQASEIPVVLSPRERGFDTVWPAEPAGGAAKQGDVAPAPSGDAVPARSAAAPQAVTILKSGVIEGMAYTLYSDGSIEAELPQGIMRFATIDELRVHLANSAA